MSQELDLFSIDPWSLPFVELAEKSELPDHGGIYFVIKLRRVLYIGKADKSLKTRWTDHHRFDRLKDLGGVRIAYWQKPDEDERKYVEIESRLINIFNPELNRTPVVASELREAYQRSAITLELERFKGKFDAVAKHLYGDCFCLLPLWLRLMQ